LLWLVGADARAGRVIAAAQACPKDHQLQRELADRVRSACVAAADQ
jgi:hypothetical protein